MSKHVVVVTGASRGLGRGVARAFGSKGFTVVLTGRDAKTLAGAADEVKVAGGQPIVVQCDHASDEAVRALFERVREECGRLDILVNNATHVNMMAISRPGGFWEKPLDLGDMITVGLRSSYVAAYHATPLMIETGGALMAHISFYGAVSYHYGPGYGAAKAGTDKMSFDMAHDLRSRDVASVSIWPGYILTDMLKSIPKEHLPERLIKDLPNFETPEFTGLVIERLWRDPERMSFSGQTLIGAELGRRFGIKDRDGKAPLDYSARLGSPNDRFIIDG
jgi:NAD(P)-dependent dehydrogenase (short-subunit alcohol dehydrogenase family)